MHHNSAKALWWIGKQVREWTNAHKKTWLNAQTNVKTKQTNLQTYVQKNSQTNVQMNEDMNEHHKERKECINEYMNECTKIMIITVVSCQMTQAPT